MVCNLFVLVISCRLQVESYIHNLFMSAPFLRDIPKNAPVQGKYIFFVLDVLIITFSYIKHQNNQSINQSDMFSMTRLFCPCDQRILILSFVCHFFLSISLSCPQARGSAPGQQTPRLHHCSVCLPSPANQRSGICSKHSKMDTKIGNRKSFSV